MHLVCLDLEGVLIPEIWQATATATGISELNRTTREEPDYYKLMRFRLDLLQRYGVGIRDIQNVIKTLNPLPGAVELVEWLQTETRLIILSDTFVEFARPLMLKLGFPLLFCHHLMIDSKGRIIDYQLRQKDAKRKAILALRQLHFKVIAVGDSYNDLPMILSAHQGLLFRPPQSLVQQYTYIPVVNDYGELRAKLHEYFKRPS